MSYVVRSTDQLRKNSRQRDDLAIEPGTMLGVLGANGSGGLLIISARRAWANLEFA